MFNNISWQGYWTTLAVITAGYYLIIYLLYFRKDFQVLVNRKTGTNSPVSLNSAPTIQGKTKESQEDSGQPSLFEDSSHLEVPSEKSNEYPLYACMDELNAFFEQAKRSKTTREELIYSLQVILKKYPALKVSEYKEPLTNVMVTQCEDICSIRLSAEDMVRVWMGG